MMSGQVKTFIITVKDKEGRKVAEEEREAIHVAHAIVQAIYRIPEHPLLTEFPITFTVEVRSKPE